ncbi:hypothetical protein DM860_011221 [Cuscuta australis]|uniref:Dolichol-phosphate mannosyltransferase subunit 3 n=1 Tax=Cuscuta australis TaxID=267555 RepID=A0A328DTV4_9ASTE|nr:hypothetical protein DM860_011221 [Cuscuta australis]
MPLVALCLRRADDQRPLPSRQSDGRRPMHLRPLPSLRATDQLFKVRRGDAFSDHRPTPQNPTNRSLFFSRAHQMKHIVKIFTILVAVSALWTWLLKTAVLPESYTWLLPIYFVVSLGCYGLVMVGVGLMQFPTCPQEAVLLQQDILEAQTFLKTRGVDVG